MGEYIYRLKGTKSFTPMIVNGNVEKVFDLIYFYKPLYSTFWDRDQPRWMRGVNMLAARLENLFAKVGYPKYVRHAFVEKDGTLTYCESNKVYPWKRECPTISDSCNIYDEMIREGVEATPIKK